MSTEGRHKIDWEEAFAYYASLRPPARAFATVAQQFGVSDVAVGKHARLNEWEARVRRLDLETRRQVEKRVVRDRAARIADTIELVDLARQELLALLRAGKAEVRLADLPNLVRLEALLEGEATDRVEVREVREFMVRVFVELDRGLGEILDAEELAPERRQVIVGGFRQRTREAIQLVSGLTGEGEEREEPAA